MPKTSDEYRKEAEAIYESERFDEALALYNEGLVHFPEDVELLVGRGLCLFAQREYPLARRDLEKVLKKDPDNAAALLGLVETYGALGLKNECAGCLRRMIAAGEVDKDLAFMFGDSMLEYDMWSDAAACFSLAINLGSEEHRAWVGLAVALQHMNYGPAARAILERLSREHPQDAEVSTWLGLVCYFAKDKKSAVAAWKNIPCEKHYDPGAVKRLLCLTKPAKDDAWGKALRKRLKELNKSKGNLVEDLLKDLSDKLKKQGRPG